MVVIPMHDGLNNPVVAGFMLGLVMIGPDHLGTLMSLSTLTSGLQSLKVGMCWGFGHSIGMALLLPPFMLLQHFSREAIHITVDQWEYWGDYFVGASMIAIAIYFFICESWYLEQKIDGTYAVRSCDCCHTICEKPLDVECESCERQDNSGCASRASCGKHFCAPFSVHRQNTESTPLARGKASGSSRADVWDVRNTRTVFLGIFQGLCCPMAFMGMGFIGKMSAEKVTNLALFFMIFLIVSVLGSGCLTYCWGFLSSRGLVSCVSPLVVYRVANLLTLSLGVIWIAANASGILHYVNYMEGMHQMEPAEIAPVDRGNSSMASVA